MHKAALAFQGSIYAGAENEKKGDIRPPPPLIDFGMFPSLSTGPSGKAALSNFKTSALCRVSSARRLK
jgi:hypothetical protein